MSMLKPRAAFQVSSRKIDHTYTHAITLYLPSLMIYSIHRNNRISLYHQTMQPRRRQRPLRRTQGWITGPVEAMTYIIKTGLRVRYQGTSNILRDISWLLFSLRNSHHFKVTGAFAENMSIRVHLFKNSTESVRVYHKIGMDDLCTQS